MRQLDNWIAYEDTEGNPFQGKFTFYKLSTSDKVVITDLNGTPLSNPLLSDMYGRTETQVFLPDEDVTVVLHKWIGPGSMDEHDTNDSHWTLVRSFDTLAPKAVLDIDGEAVNAVRVPTMEDLRELDFTGINYVVLCGYYEMGDMPPANYQLVEGTGVTDTGGDIIVVDSNHFWKLIPDRVIDLRIFGAFPTNVYTQPGPRQSQISHCFRYANGIGHDVYMPQVYEGNNYYFFEGGSYGLTTRLIIDKDVKIVCKSNTTSVFTFREIQHPSATNIFSSNGGNGQIYINATEMHSSWFNPSWATFPGVIRKVILDTRYGAFTFKDCIVEVIQTQVNKNFTFQNCRIEADKKFSDCILTFENCGYVSDNWLHPNVTSTVNLSGNIIKLSNMTSANAYIDWKNKQLEYDYGDIGEQEVDAIIHAGCVLENGYGKLTLATGSTGNVELHNFSGTLYNFGASNSLNAIDCWLTFFANSSTVPLDSVQLRRGSLSGYSTTDPALTIQALTSFYAENTAINTPVKTLGATAEIKNCTINANITCTDIKLERDVINAGVYQQNVDREIHPDVAYCRFNGPNGKHYLSSTLPTTVVKGKWVHNDANGEMNFNPISIDLTNIYASDLAHIYQYEDNTGRFLPKYPKITFSQSKFWYVPEVIRNLNHLPGFTLIHSSLVLPTIQAPLFTGIQVSSDWFVACHFFSIGEAYAIFRLTVSFAFTNTTELNDSMTPRVTAHNVSFSAEKAVTVQDSLTYNFAEFAGEKFGQYMPGPKHFDYPSEIETVDPDTWPETNSATVTVERIR